MFGNLETIVDRNLPKLNISPVLVSYGQFQIHTQLMCLFDKWAY